MRYAKLKLWLSQSPALGGEQSREYVTTVLFPSWLVILLEKQKFRKSI